MNEDSAKLPARLEALEVRAAHQDVAIADLNDMVTKQWSRIAALERQLTALREEMRNKPQDQDGQDPPPPHY